tara:strand:- start:1929 stop:3224 length:1296 start_codon:yes stop_codon:yes gene_type:complete
MATWKKVYTSGDTVPVTDGGTGLTTLTNNGIIVGNATSAPQFVNLSLHQLLVGGASGVPVAKTALASGAAGNEGDILVTHQAGGLHLNIQANKVTGTMVAADTLDWATHESSGTAKTMPYYDASGNAGVIAAPPQTSGIKTLQSASGAAPAWAAQVTSLSNLTATGVNDNVSYPIGFLSQATITSDTSSGHYYDNNSTFAYNPSVNLLSVPKITTSGVITATGGVFGDLTGTASKVSQTAQTGNPAAAKLLLAGSSNTVVTNTGLTFDASSGSSGVLTVPNLVVSGTTTTVNSTTVTISDKTLQLGYDADQNTHVTDASVVGSGIVLGVSGALTGAGNTAAATNAKSPRLAYLGRTSTVSPSKWGLAKSEITNLDDSGTLLSNHVHGIAVMDVSSSLETPASNASGFSDGDIIGGVGSFFFGTGGLYIRTV